MTKRILALAILALLVTVPAFAAKPILHFSDLTSGPATGLGDGNGSGAIVTVWGHNLGTSQGDSAIYVGGNESSYVYYWGNSDGASGGGPANLYASHKMQEIVFSVPEMTNGTKKIKVTVDGNDSNELDFTVNSGHIYFIDPDSPDDPGSGTWASPFKSPSSYITKISSAGGNEDGDIAYFMDGNYTGEYITTAWRANFFLGTTHSGISGAENAFVGYPGQNSVYITYFHSTSTGTNFHLNASAVGVHGAEYITIAKLRTVADGPGVIAGSNYRVVGNSMNNLLEYSPAGAVGFGFFSTDSWGSENVKVLGNEITGGTAGTTVDHAIYPGALTANIDVGWNYTHDDKFGGKVSINRDGAWASGYTMTNILVHDNYFDVVNSSVDGRAVIVFETGEGSSIYVYNNIVKGPNSVANTWTMTALSGNVYYYNNTIYKGGPENSGSTMPVFYAFAQDLHGHNYAPESLTYINNIVEANANTKYYIKAIVVDGNGTTPSITIQNNLWYGTGAFADNVVCDLGTCTDVDSQDNVDPKFTSSSDYSLQADSPAIGTGSNLNAIFTTDFMGELRGTTWDIGAVEYSTESDNETIDIAAPTISAFTCPETSGRGVMSGITFTASDGVGVTGYLINEVASQPALDDEGWAGSAQSSYTWSTAGSKTLYGWAKDAAGNISLGSSCGVTVTMPEAGASTAGSFTGTMR